jgi:hypothetical protein
MTAVKDRRFEQGDWPIRIEVSQDRADSWLRYLADECQRRSWGTSSMGQIDAGENSGSINITPSGRAQGIGVVWERKRNGPMKARARSTGEVELPLADLQQFFGVVDGRCRSRETERIYRRGQLQYEGLAWKGEVWLDDHLCLAPPSRQDQTALIGPRIILVDAQVECIGPSDASWVFDRELRDLSTFLTVAMGVRVRLPPSGRSWTWTENADGCAVRWLGYLERENPNEIPARGSSRPMPLRNVSRPDFSLRGIDGTTDEFKLPSDVTELWAAYRSLTPDRRRDFLQAAKKWQEALSQDNIDGRTLSYALMVVACEALKPPGREFREYNIYHVVEALLGNAIAERLKRDRIRPQDIRSSHLHRGEFHDGEIALAAIMSSYRDPTFDQARRDLYPIAQACIIEWLKRGGELRMPAVSKKKNSGDGSKGAPSPSYYLW